MTFMLMSMEVSACRLACTVQLAYRQWCDWLFF